MNTKLAIQLIITTLAVFTNFGQVSPSDDGLVERGASYRIWQPSIRSTNQVTGEITTNVSRYTELGDGLCYWENGTWQDSQDLIEITPDGAAALHGQTKAYFAPNLNAAGAIKLVTASGQVFQSHPDGLYYEDTASGKVVLIASAADSTGTLVPPNSVVYADAFDGVKADMVFVYAKNGFEQNVVFLEAPPSPTAYGLDPATTRLQVRTIFDRIPVMQREQQVVLKKATNPQTQDLTDDMLFFDDLWFPVGAAFAADHLPVLGLNEAARVRLPDPSNKQNLLVAKQLAKIGKDTILIESIDYLDILPKLKSLDQAAVRLKGTASARRVASASLPLSASGQNVNHRMVTAGAPYVPRGVVWDYTTLYGGSQSSYTFSSGSTYVISNSVSFSSTATATFQANSVIKYAGGTYMQLSGPVSFPASGTAPVFTTTDDNSYGALISNSTGKPGYSAGAELVFYYNNNASTVQNARFRFATEAVQYGGDAGEAYITYNLNSSTFENCSIGVYENVSSLTTVALSGDTSCNVTTPFSYVAGGHSGSITSDCGTVNISQMSYMQAEACVAINPANPANIAIFSNCDQAGLFSAITTNGGGTWSTGFVANGADVPSACCDPSAAFDSYGNLLLAYVDANVTNVYVVCSTNAVAGVAGTNLNFTVVGQFYSVYGMDFPKLAVGPGGATGTNSVWVTYKRHDSTGTYIDAAGARITGLGATNIGSFTTSSGLPGSHYCVTPNIAVGPAGNVVVSYVAVFADSTTKIYVVENGTVLQTPSWSGATEAAHPNFYSAKIPAQSHRAIYSMGFLAFDRGTYSAQFGRLYMVYTDCASTSSTNNTNIYLKYSDDSSATWSSAKLVNDSGTNSHFLPALAVDQPSGHIAVSWYDSRNDSSNVRAEYFAAVGWGAGPGFGNNFKVSQGQSDTTALTDDQYFDYGDFTGVDFYGGFLRCVWSDNSNVPGGNPNHMPGTDDAMDIYSAVIAY